MFKKIIFPNGLRVVLAPMKSTKTITVLAVFGVGSKYESNRLAGISHFLEHMFFKGTKKRPTARIISEYLDEVGGDYNAFTTKEYTGYYAKVASQHAERAFDIIADILLHSKFAARDIERERGVVIEEMNMYQDMPAVYVSDILEELIYGRQPAGRLIIGDKKSVLGVRRQDFLDYYQRFYTANNLVVCVTGNFAENQGLSLVKKYFTEVAENRSGSKKPVVEKQTRPALLLHYKKTDQTHICLAFRAYNLFDERRHAAHLLSVILGGGMSSRLFMLVREQLGLAYYINCESQLYSDTGYLNIHSGLDKNKITRAITVILRELTKIKNQGVSEKELNKAREYIKGQTVMGLETSDSYAAWLATQEVLTKNIQTVKEKFARLAIVTPADIKKVAREILVNKKMNLAVIGPYQDQQKFQRLLKV